MPPFPSPFLPLRVHLVPHCDPNHKMLLRVPIGQTDLHPSRIYPRPLVPLVHLVPVGREPDAVHKDPCCTRRTVFARIPTATDVQSTNRIARSVTPWSCFVSACPRMPILDTCAAVIVSAIPSKMERSRRGSRTSGLREDWRAACHPHNQFPGFEPPQADSSADPDRDGLQAPATLVPDRSRPVRQSTRARRPHSGQSSTHR